MTAPIINPANPFVGAIRMFPGAMIKISGQAQPNATRFAINLQVGPSMNPRDDLALHLSPCFTPPRVIRNSLIRGQWGIEEAWSNGVVVNPHQPFEIIILTETDQFKIAINGGHFCEFRHRVPYQQITHLTIDGDVNVSQIDMQPAGVNLSTNSYQSPNIPTQAPSAPYPTPNASGMPMPMPTPSLYPSAGLLPTGGGIPQAGGYPPSMPGPYPQPGVPSGPMPSAAGYSTGYPTQPVGYPTQPAGYPTQPTGYPAQQNPYQGGTAGPSGPMPTGAGYMGGYPQHQQAQSGPSIPGLGNLPINGKALGALAGLGIGAATAAAALSIASKPLKHAKKLMKPKLFRSGSSSSDSSRSSFSSFSS